MRYKRALGVLLVGGLLAAASSAIPSHAAEAPPVHLVKDLATQPGMNDSSDATEYAQLGSQMLFVADDGVFGEELWITDGTPGGTSFFKDLNPGPTSSYPHRFTLVGSKLFFLTYEDEDGLYDLWVTDGTPAGTIPLLPDMDEPERMVAYDGDLFFFEGSPTILRRSDGTPAGTVTVKDFSQDLQTINPAVLGSDLIFSGNGGGVGYELWISDGTTDGTGPFKDLVTGPNGSAPEQLTVVGSTLYFRAYEPTETYRTLWKSDGTPAGTVVVEDPATTGPGNANALTAVGTDLFFLGADATEGEELWVSDGSEAGTHIVEALTPGDGSSTIGNIVAMGGQAYFLLRNSGISELWVSDGTPENTEVLDEVSPSGAQGADKLTAGAGALFFASDDGTNGKELWSSDGSAGNAAMLVDLAPGPAWSDPQDLVFGANGLLYFTALGPVGSEPYVATATTATLLRDIKPPSSSFLDEGFVAAGSNVYFAYDDGVHGSELWRSNGTATGTVMVEDIVSGSEGSSPGNLAAMNGIIYFSATTASHGGELWRSDGTELGTYRLTDVNPDAANALPSRLTPVGDTMYFMAYRPDLGLELWKTSGVQGDEELVKDINPAGNSTPDYLTAVGSELWFSAPESGGIYKTNGTEVGTILVDPDVLSGSHFVSFDGEVYFYGYGSGGTELWKSDGTADGTVPITNQSGGLGGFDPRDLTVFGNALYFLANEDGDQTKPHLYRTTGTTVSTVPISPPSLDSVDHLRKVGSRLVFAADDGVNGNELWRSDGTVAGTTMVKNIGPGDSLVQEFDHPWMTVIGKALYFVADDGTHAEELWVSDGTAANTFMVQDFNTLSGTLPAHITALKNQILFDGVTQTQGRELLGLTAPRPSKLSLKVTKKRRRVRARGVLDPAHTGAPITVTLYKKRNGKFRKVATKKPSSNSAGSYSTRFRRPGAARCRITAEYLGHVDHLPVKRSVRFAC